jgi:hypothetical protein
MVRYIRVAALTACFTYGTAALVYHLWLEARYARKN